MEVLIEATELLEKYRDDKSVSRDDILDSMEDKLSLLMGKLIAVPTCTSMLLFKTNED